MLSGGGLAVPCPTQAVVTMSQGGEGIWTVLKMQAWTLPITSPWTWGGHCNSPSPGFAGLKQLFVIVQSQVAGLGTSAVSGCVTFGKLVNFNWALVLSGITLLTLGHPGGSVG